MQVYCLGTARIRHHDTGEIYEIESDELDWEIVDSDERGMGEALHHEASVDHPVLGLLTWGLWEYPVGAQNHEATDVGQHEIVEDFDYGLEHEPPEPDLDEWLDLTPPGDPCSVFLRSFRETTDLLASHGSDDGGHLVNRLVFSHQITALETYLGDTLLNEVFSDSDALQRLVDESDDLKKEKFTLSEISKDLTLVQGKVRSHLRGILYHNLAKVDVLYRIALGLRLLDRAADKEFLFRLVSLRHDCVHRNGNDKDGNEQQIFTRTFVRQAADAVRDFVENVDAAVRSRASYP
ncbi:hypothetical protein [Bradyrhizobium sp. HKCCYLR20261]|uniref:hypothetical protein n=1 Tax=Bradyrhizobium sp. HKCCYLR20261 TaxID=3420760 RepID=UPI003EB9A439